jgi:hypothetical protein
MVYHSVGEYRYCRQLSFGVFVCILPRVCVLSYRGVHPQRGVSYMQRRPLTEGYTIQRYCASYRGYSHSVVYDTTYEAEVSTHRSRGIPYRGSNWTPGTMAVGRVWAKGQWLTIFMNTDNLGSSKCMYTSLDSWREVFQKNTRPGAKIQV